MPHTIDPFESGTVEHVSRAIADVYTGSELTVLLSEVPLRNDPGPSVTKWRRVAQALSANQASTTTGNALVRLVTLGFAPERTLSRKSAADAAKDEINQALSLAGLQIRADGKVARTARTHTDSEALDRSARMRTLLARRDAHPAVIAGCRPELLRTDYYEVVFEGVKGLGDRLRKLSGIDDDGYGLIASALEGRTPQLMLNTLRNRRERDEQLGIASLAKGLFSAFRNPAAHEPRLVWTMSEQDALDVLGTLSLVHRRLDDAMPAVRSAG